MIRSFLDANFLLRTDTAVELYRRHAEKLPVADYHTRLRADLIAAWFSADKRIVDRNEVCPQDQSAEQVEETGKAQMTASQDSAVIAALVETGKAGAMHLTVTEATEQQTSTEIQAGDVLETITPEGGQTTTLTSFSQLRELMTTIPEGTRVTLGVRRGEQKASAALTTIAPQEGTTGSLLGLSLKISVDSPVEATFGLSDVGGPSAGMMFALGVVDEITPGSLTGGKDISGTGTIDMTGQVGPIGGIQQKMAGARESGSTFFLAPASNCNEVKGHEPKGMQVFAVNTLHEAVAPGGGPLRDVSVRRVLGRLGVRAVGLGGLAATARDLDTWGEVRAWDSSR